jgi:hypothetical protein
LKIGRLDKIAIDNAQAANAGAHQQASGCRTDGTATDQYGAGGQQTLLASATDALKQNLSRVFFLKKILHGFRGPGEPCSAARCSDDSAKRDRRGNAAVLPFV